MTRRSALFATIVVALVSQLATCTLIAPTSSRWDGMPGPTFPKLLLWNASASVPRGLYVLRSPFPLHVGELVGTKPPEPLAALLASRGYLPLGVTLLKHIAALGGQTVCRHAHDIAIDGRFVAAARERDRHGRLLPSWQGCRRLRAGEVFLLNPAVPDSLDGRYFGALSVDAIATRAEPLWTVPER